MRPSRRLLLMASAIGVLSLFVLALPDLPPVLIPAVWAILAVVAAADAVTIPPARLQSLSVSAPGEVFVGETAPIAFQLIPSGPRRPRAAEISARLAWPEGLKGPADFRLRPVADRFSAEIEVRGRRRGDWPLGALYVLRRGRLGLVESVARNRCEAHVKVVPNVRSVTSGEIDLQIASGTFGERAAAMRGEGSEFHQLREFVYGMDPRTIDYKRSARHGALVAREMRTERNHNIILALDNGHLMREQVRGLAKIDHMINAALALAWAGIQGGDLVGLYAFDARPRLFLPPSGGRPTFARLRSQTAALSYRSVESNPTLAMTHLSQRLARRSLVVVFSDFVDTTTAELLLENVQMLNRHHVVVFVSLRDPLLEDYTRRSARDLAEVAESVAAAGLSRERRLVLERLMRLGVFVIDTAPGGLTTSLISAYLTIRARELI
ncbi:DUF58 domain-containing protein [Consotaella aegiceratis]|uniref:DUF58 domain-containing protein n=1 Tax=Consotaella aegiceratis TaxID=3097961 RepID=UPI002F40E237